MTDRNTRGQDWGLLILRLGVAALLVTHHGWDKFLGATAYLFGGKEWGFDSFVASIGFPFPVFFALCAAFSEFGGCLLLAAGLLPRYAAGLLAISMSVAVYFHLRNDMQYELAALYLLAAVFFILSGAGKFSIEEWWHDRSKKRLATPVRTAA